MIHYVTFQTWQGLMATLRNSIYYPEALTNEVIDALISLPKRWKKGSTSYRPDPRGLKWDCELQAIEQTLPHRFKVFLRQSPKLEDSFSVGLTYKIEVGKDLVLMRINGSSHEHTNPIIDGAKFQGFHIHKATHEAISAGLSPDVFASLSYSYTDFSSALNYAWKLWNVANPVDKVFKLNYATESSILKTCGTQLPLLF